MSINNEIDTIKKYVGIELDNIKKYTEKLEKQNNFLYQKINVLEEKILFTEKKILDVKNIISVHPEKMANNLSQ